MPYYDYRCEECKYSDELFFKISEKPDTVDCSICGQEMKQQVSSPVFQGYSTNRFEKNQFENGVKNEEKAQKDLWEKNKRNEDTMVSNAMKDGTFIEKTSDL